MTSNVSVLDRAAGMEDPGRVADVGRQRPDPEVPERARRRSFTAQYKLRVLGAYEAAVDGEKGAVLRREGLYSSHITAWRHARDAGALAGLALPRGRKRRDRQVERINRLQAEKQQLEPELAKPASWWMCRQNCTRSGDDLRGARSRATGHRRE